MPPQPFGELKVSCIAAASAPKTSRPRCSRSTCVRSASSAVKRTSTSDWIAGSWSNFAFSCQASTTRAGGSHASTWPQSQSLPSVPRSNQRPPTRGSMRTSAQSAAPMWCDAIGHQAPMLAVKTSNAIARGARTSTLLLHGLDGGVRNGNGHGFFSVRWERAADSAAALKRARPTSHMLSMKSRIEATPSGRGR